MSNHVDHTASYLLDLEDPASEERWSIYRCDTCFALVASPDAADHGAWHLDQHPAEISAEPSCPGHKLVQHRDMKRPWCNSCGRAADGELIGRPKS